MYPICILWLPPAQRTLQHSRFGFQWLYLADARVNEQRVTAGKGLGAERCVGGAFATLTRMPATRRGATPRLPE